MHPCQQDMPECRAQFTPHNATMQQCNKRRGAGYQLLFFLKIEIQKRNCNRKGITGIQKIKFEGVDYTNEESASVVVDWWTMIEQKPRSQAAPFTLNHNRELDNRKSAPVIDGRRCEQGAATPLSATAHYSLSLEAAFCRFCCSFGTWFDRKLFSAIFLRSISSAADPKQAWTLLWPTTGAQETN